MGRSLLDLSLRTSASQTHYTQYRLSGVSRLIANHPHFANFESVPEVRALSSAGVTRLRRSYDPVRHPSDPPLRSGVEAATSDPDGSPSITRITIPTCCVPYPGRPDRCVCRLLPCPRGLPRAKGGSASASTLSRPARTSLTLRPAGSLGRPRRPLSRGFDEASCPAAPLVSFRINRQLSGWNLPP